MCTYMYSSSQGFSKRERLEYIHIYILYMCVQYTYLHMYSEGIRRERERDWNAALGRTGDWAGN